MSDPAFNFEVFTGKGAGRGRKPLPTEHGTHREYRKGCRCDACRVANTEHRRRQRRPRASGDQEGTSG